MVNAQLFSNSMLRVAGLTPGRGSFRVENFLDFPGPKGHDIRRYAKMVKLAKKALS